MVRATRRKTDQPPEARPGAVQDTAMERRGAQVLRVKESRAPQGAIQKSASWRSIPPACPEGGGERQAAPGL